MNKYLMMSAAAALATATTGTAQAGSVDVHFGTSAGGSYCDGFVGVSTATYVVGQFVYTNCSPSSIYDKNLETIGLISKGDKGIPGGKRPKVGNVGLADPANLVFYGIYSEAFLVDFQTPIKAGGKWDLWIGFETSGFLANSGVLLSGQYARVPGAKVESMVAKLGAVLKATK